MSQPYDRAAKVPQPGKLDKSLGEFWVENPWEIVAHGHNLSCYERNRAYLNVAGTNFLEISSLTGADSDGDARCAVAADFRNDGRLDLVVRQVGGGALLLFENQFTPRHYLKVSLRGTKSNRLGIGARLVATVQGRKIVRELYPHNSYRSQSPSHVHFGLGDRLGDRLGDLDKVDRLEIHWPSGVVQALTDLKADRHIIVEEGKEGDDAVETVTPGQTIRP